MLIYVVLALIVGSIGSVAMAGILLLAKKDILEKISTKLMYLAGGTLLGAAFLGMLPKALKMMDVQNVLIFVLIGILFFFILEKIILWRTCHKEDCERHVKAVAPMILIGDSFHNAIDGIVIAASFLTSYELGFFVTFSVIFHEIPQELADFGVLLKSGMTKRKALFYNMLSSSAAFFSGILAYFFLEHMQFLIPYALAFSASSFIYIALADLIPEMHKKTSIKESLSQIILVVLGIFTIYFIKNM
ncbi:MAG: ZIP family metal transporter [Bacteroidales bacterium]|nr:ZIP family metal transporter [Bacteroidales bacterium]